VLAQRQSLAGLDARARLDRNQPSRQATSTRIHFQRPAGSRHQIFKGLQRCRPFHLLGDPRVARTEEEAEKLRPDAHSLSRRVRRGRSIQPAQVLVHLLAAVDDDDVIHFPLCSQQWPSRYVASYDGRGPHTALDGRTLDDACFNGLQFAAAP